MLEVCMMKIDKPEIRLAMLGMIEGNGHPYSWSAIVNGYNPDEMAKEEMAQILSEIQDGTFAREWILENQANRPVFTALRRMDAEHPIEIVGAELRKMMPWLKTAKR